jgi:hypothetical protein
MRSGANCLSIPKGLRGGSVKRQYPPRIHSDLTIGQEASHPVQVEIRDFVSVVDGWQLKIGEKQLLLSDKELTQLLNFLRNVQRVRQGVEA